MTIKYVFDRTIQLVLVIFIAMTVNFILPRVIPGDPVEAFLRSKMATSGGTVTFDIAKVGEEYRRKFDLTSLSGCNMQTTGMMSSTLSWEFRLSIFRLKSVIRY